MKFDLSLVLSTAYNDIEVSNKARDKIILETYLEGIVLKGNVVRITIYTIIYLIYG